MAGSASIKLDLRANADMLAKDLRDAKDAVKPLVNDLGNAVKRIRDSKEAAALLNKQLKDMEKAGKAFESKQAELEKATAEIEKQQTEYQRIVSEIQNAERHQADLNAKIKEFRDSAGASKEAWADIAPIVRHLVEQVSASEGMVAGLNVELERTTDALEVAMDSMVELAREASDLEVSAGTEGDVARIHQELSDLTVSMRTAESEAKQIEKAISGLVSSVAGYAGGVPKTIDDVTAAIARLNEELQEQEQVIQGLRQNLQDALGAGVDIEFASKLAIELSKVKDEIPAISAEMDKLREAIQEALRVEDTALAKMLQGELDQLTEAFTNMKAESKGAQETLSELGVNPESLNTVTELARKLEEAKAAASVTAGEMSRLERAGADLDRPAISMVKFGKGAVVARNSLAALNTATVNFGRVARVAFAAAARAMSAIYRGAARGARAIGSVLLSFRNLIPAMRQTNRQGQGFLRWMAGSQFSARRFLTVALVFNAVRRAMADLSSTMGALVRSNDNLMASMNVIRVNAWTAFAPIWTAVLPALEALAAALAVASHHLATFIALLGGMTWSAARDAGEALRDQAAGYDEVGAAAREARREVFGFDQVNQIAQETAAGGADGGMPDFGTVDPMVIEWLERLREALDGLTDPYERGFEVGRAISEQITQVLEDIDWGPIQQRAAEWGQRVAGFLNGALTYMPMWYQIGRNLAEAANTALTFAYELLDLTGWREIGWGIGTMINSFNDYFEWDLAADVFSMAVNSFFEVLAGIIEAVRWGSLGTNMGKAVSRGILGIQWRLVFGTMGEGVNALTEWFDAFVAAFEGEKIGRTIMDGLNYGIGTIRWGDDGIGGALGRGLNEATATMIAALDEFDEELAADSLTEMVNSFIRTVKWGRDGVAGVLIYGINTAFSFLYTAITGFDIQEAVSAVTTFVNDFVSDVDWPLIGGTISEFFKGALEFIGGAIDGVNWAAVGAAIVSAIVAVDWPGLFFGLVDVIAAAYTGIITLAIGAAGHEEFAEESEHWIREAMGYIVNPLEGWKTPLSIIFNGLLGQMGFGEWAERSQGFINNVAGAFGFFLDTLNPLAIVPRVRGLIDVFRGGAEEIEEIFVEMEEPVTRFSENISRETKGLLDPMIQNSRDARDALIGVFVEGGEVSATGTAEIIGYFTNMATTAISEVERMRDQTIAGLAEIFGTEAQEYERSRREIERWANDAIAAREREMQNMQNRLRTLQANGKEETEEFTRISTELGKLQDSHQEFVDNVAEIRDADLKALRENTSDQLESFWEVRDGVEETYGERIDIIETAQEEMLEATRDFLSDTENITLESLNDLLSMQESHLSEIIGAVSKNDTERQEMQDRLHKYLEQGDKEHLQTLYDEARKHMLETIRDTNAHYDELVRLAEENWDTLTSEQQEAVTEALRLADEQRTETIREAEEMYKGVRTAVSSMGVAVGSHMGGMGDVATREAIRMRNGVVSEMQGMETETRSITERIAGLFSSMLSGLQSANSTIRGFTSGWSIPFFANGTGYAPGGLAVLGERGPEIVEHKGKRAVADFGIHNLPKGAKVIPNHKIKQYAKKIANPISHAATVALSEAGSRKSTLSNGSIGGIVNGLSQSFAMTMVSQGMGGNMPSHLGNVGGQTEVVLQIDGREFARGYLPYHEGEIDRIGVNFA